MKFIEPWHRASDSAPLELQLRAECPPGHMLHDIPTMALARRADTDDVLFVLQDGSGRAAEVHLTWSQNIDAGWPKTKIYSTIAAWAIDSQGIGFAENMIFVMKPLGLNTLEDFAQRVAKDLGLAEFHERESSSYANGHYFTGKLGISWLKVFECSDLGVQEFYGAIGIDPPGTNNAHDIATSLAATGFQCMIPYETWIFEAGSQQGAKYGF